MRPLSSGPDSDTHIGGASRSNLSAMPPSPQLSCFITTEAALDSAGSQQMNHPHRVGRWTRPKRSLDFASQSSRTTDSSPAPAPHSPASLSSSVLDDDMLHEQLPPLTPVLHGLSGPASTISSSSSRRNSLTASSCADKDSVARSTRPSPPHSPRRRPRPSSQQGAAESPESQLIMPSLTVPPRRSFSEIGRAIGKLKILVTGPAGIGKTSLINSITRCCDHIVHVDPPRSSSTPATETFASTKPQPKWKTELELSASTRRRRSSLTPSDEVLDRNVCFVDTSGHTSAVRPMHVALQYIESQVTPLLYKSMDDSDLWSLLLSGSQPAVDVVLYMIPSTGLEATDVDAMKRLQNYTSIILLLARADEFTDTEFSTARSDLHATLKQNDIHCFSFGGSTAVPELYMVSNKTCSDPDEMDASTLMQSEYRQPLIQSELQQLVDRMFCADGSAWLRHTTALKILKWCTQHRQTRALQLVAHPRAPQHVHFGGLHGMDAYAAAQWWQRVEVTDWAQSLRRSLDSQHSGMVFPTGTLEIANGEPARSVVTREKGRKHRSRPGPSPTHQDPLGLLDWLSHARQGGRLTVELLSGLGVAAFVTVWLQMSDSACHREVTQMPRGLIGWWWDIM
ncbi:hypothetical protein NLU13_6898 [Sarocladium strictum]|uniref:Septin-type G domain-containing protein n=1 Tax=Sarocladium strictum TaxID=5046 RepID=A0AA39GET5_SARSR|nr:hypothetical protein NLU13_6898 [Sarocladium strictum]